ncbi:MAG: DUF1552 domain-containing protein [Myxococcota bacterium]
MSKLTRRHLLRGAGGIVLGVPFLASLAPRESRAQDGVPRRFAVIWQNNGIDYQRFWPENYGALSDASFNGRGIEALRPWRDRLLIARGFDMGISGRGGHEGSTALTGTSSGRGDNMPDEDSVDQVIADSINPSGVRPLALTVRRVRQNRTDVKHHLAFRGGNGVFQEMNPWTVYSGLTGLDSGGSTASAEAAMRVQARRESVLDLVSGRLDLLRNRRIGAEDKQKLDAHFEAVRELEMGMTEIPTVETRLSGDIESDMQTYDLPERDLYGSETFPTVGRLHLEIIALAFRTGVNQVATMMYGKESEGARYNFEGMNHDASHHGISHRKGSDYHQPMHEIDRWHGRQMDYLLTRLERVGVARDGSGGVPLVEANGMTCLDNSLVFWGNSMTDGQRHHSNDMPCVMAGSAGGYLRQGQYLDVRLGGRKRGHNQLLNTFVNAVGISSPQFGNGDPGEVNEIVA